MKYLGLAFMMPFVLLVLYAVVTGFLGLTPWKQALIAALALFFLGFSLLIVSRVQADNDV